MTPLIRTLTHIPRRIREAISNAIAAAKRVPNRLLDTQLDKTLCKWANETHPSEED